MIRNYLKAAFRTILRQRTNTVINIVGLTLGITGSLIMFLIVKDGASFDKYHSRYDRIYRVVSQSKENGNDAFTEGVPTVLPETFKADFPEVEECVFTSYRRNSLISVVQRDGSVKKYEESQGVAITQPTFFRIFDRGMLIGSSEKGLDDPNEAIISKRWAEKYFGRTDAIGEVLHYDNNEYRITAVMEDYPDNTDFPFDLMLSYITVKKPLDERGWGSVSDSDNCYFLVHESKSIDGIIARMPAFVTKYMGANDENAQQKSFIIQPLRELHSDMRFGTYNKKMPTIAAISFTVIGVFLLLTACVNFINLTTAEAVKRTKEVGIRKTLGSTRGQLILKFISETFLVTLMAMALSLALTQVALALLNPFLGLSIKLGLLNDYMLWIFLVLLTAGVSLFSGLYPAFVVSGFKPAAIMKGQLSSKNTSGYTFRKSLVVVQFFISQLFIMVALVMGRQMNFMHQKDLGFTKDQIITIPIPVRENARETGKMRTLKTEILRLPGVEQASLNFMPPASGTSVGASFKIEGHEEEISTNVKHVDADYISLFKIELTAGDNLDDSDTVNGFIVNEQLAKIAGYTNVHDIVGKEIDFWGSRFPVRGVVKDFNMSALDKPIGPVILATDKGGYQNLSIKLATGNLHAAIKAIQNIWEATYPEYIFKYEFLDQQVENLYRGERKTSVIITVFASVAVIIGCLGLFGLVTFMANQKAKEIGIRKVLGATVNNVMVLFSKDFAKIILISFVLSTPISALVMNEVLKEFAYRISLGPAMFLAGLMITLMITVITVGVRSFRAASANPVNSLRSE